MLNADSSALKSESDDQRSATPPMIPSVAALSWTRWTSVRMLCNEVVGKARLSSFTRSRTRRAVDEAEQGEREENKRHEREEREVGDHRGEVGPAVGEELRGEGSFAQAHGRSLHRVSLRGHGCSSSPCRSDRDLVPDRGAVLFDEGGAVLGSTLGSDAAAQGVAKAAAQLLAGAGGFRSEGSITQLEASTAGGSVFVVRDGARRIAATTGPAPTVGSSSTT